MQTVILIVGIGTLGIISYGDVRSRRIPNVLSFAIAILGLAHLAIAHDVVAASRTVAAAAVTFVVTFLLFWRGVIGGGDAKLLAAVVLLIGHQELLGFLFLMSLCGGVLAVAILARDKLRSRPFCFLRLTSVPSAKAPGCSVVHSRSTVPYGVAIAASGAITLILEASFAR